MRSDSPVAKRAETVVMRSRALRNECRSLVARAKTFIKFDVPLRQAALNRHSSSGSRDRHWTAQIRDLSKRVVSAREDERRRIARDIHDQLGQQITALRIKLEELQYRHRQNPRLVDRAKRISQLAEELDRSMDMLVSELRPAALEQAGLAAGMRELVATWSTCFGVSAQFRASGIGELVRLPREVEINVYRVAQEALHNVHKHAGASEVNVLLERRLADVLLIVEDNGCGFNPQQLNGRRGLGIVGMQERVATIGGRLDLHSKVGNGTSVSIRVPIEPLTMP